MQESKPILRFPLKNDTRMVLPFLLLAVLALLTGLWAGLIRLGWSLPAEGVAMSHGPLMVSGFLGTLIALERVVALRKRWMFIVPLLSGIGWLASLLLRDQAAGPLLITASSLGLVLIFGIIVRRETQLYTIVMAVGALCWLIGNVLWLSGRPVFHIVTWWAAFLILTIAGERIELSRVLRTSRLQYVFFIAAAGLFLLAVVMDTMAGAAGGRLIGAAMLLLAAWLLRNDIARRNIHHPAALTRYIALCLFLGYLWLGAAGLISLAWGSQSAGPIYDAFLHAVFVGFVLSMIFGHAPIIIPAISGALVPFSKVFYLHLALLHASLILRAAGDLIGWYEGRRWGGLLNEVAVLLFVFVTAAAVVRSKRGKR